MKRPFHILDVRMGFSKQTYLPNHTGKGHRGMNRWLSGSCLALSLQQRERHCVIVISSHNFTWTYYEKINCCDYYNILWASIDTFLRRTDNGKLKTNNDNTYIRCFIAFFTCLPRKRAVVVQCIRQSILHRKLFQRNEVFIYRHFNCISY